MRVGTRFHLGTRSWRLAAREDGGGKKRSKRDAICHGVHQWHSLARRVCAAVEEEAENLDLRSCR